MSCWELMVGEKKRACITEKSTGVKRNDSLKWWTIIQCWNARRWNKVRWSVHQALHLKNSNEECCALDNIGFKFLYIKFGWTPSHQAAITIKHQASFNIIAATCCQCTFFDPVDQAVPNRHTVAVTVSSQYMNLWRQTGHANLTMKSVLSVVWAGSQFTIAWPCILRWCFITGHNLDMYFRKYSRKYRMQNNTGQMRWRICQPLWLQKTLHLRLLSIERYFQEFLWMYCVYQFI